MKKFFVILSLLLLGGLVGIKASDRVYDINLYITPPAGAVCEESEDSFGDTTVTWKLDGEEIHAMWMYGFTDLENGNPYEDYLYAMPLDYGAYDYKQNASLADYLNLSAEQFPIIVQRPPAQSQYGDQLPMTGGLLVNGLYYKFDDSGRITITEPGNYNIVGYAEDLEPAAITFTSDCDIKYSIADQDLVSVNPTTGTVSDEVYPGAVIKIYPPEGEKLSSVFLYDPKAGYSSSCPNMGEYYQCIIPSGDNFQTTAKYTITVKGDRMTIYLLSNVEGAVTKKILDVKGGTYTAVNGNKYTFTLAKSDVVTLAGKTTYKITSVTDNKGVKTLDFNPTTYEVKGVESGMELYVQMEEVVDDKTVLFAFSEDFPTVAPVTAYFAYGTARQWYKSFSSKESAVSRLPYSSEDGRIVIRRATFLDNKNVEQDVTLYVNNKSVDIDEETDTYNIPADLPSGSVLRFVSASINSISATRNVSINVEDGIDVKFLVDYRECAIPAGKFTLPTCCYITFEARENNPYAFKVRYSNEKAEGDMTGQYFRLLAGYQNTGIHVEKANKRQLNVYVEENDGDDQFTHLLLSPGKSYQTDVELTKGYQTVALAKEDLPLGLTAAEGVDAVMYLNGELLEMVDGKYSFPTDLIENSVLKIYESKAEGIKKAEVHYDVADLDDYDVVFTHDHIDKAVDTSVAHNLLPGTEIRFTISAKEAQSEPAAVKAKVVTRDNDAPYTVTANDEELTPDEDGVYMVKINDDHVANGLNIKVAKAEAEDEGPSTDIESIMADGSAADVYTPAGVLVKRVASADDVKRLPAGIYILKGKKVLVVK